MNSYYKQLVTTYKTVQYKSLSSVTVVGFILALIMVVTYQMIPAVVLAAAAIGAGYFKRYLYVEYEYEFNKDEISICKIIGKVSRKKCIEFNIKDMEILATESSKHLKAINNLPKKKLKFYPVTSKAEIYSAVVKYNGERVQLKFVPDNQFIELCYKHNSKCVKKELTN
ncbi:hypothetical protein [Clostridium muellerianum]|uniref:hypothetical protein n=1 Tax=Clostridium muellerianum TaxID=2716538 RepID=UPI001FAE581E|nr:hypothetical protein [Clostridium muellerianum]